MKLRTVDSNTSLVAKLKLLAVGAATANRPPDILRLLLYRPEIFGRHLSAWVHALLRGASSFSVGERELLAAWVSQINRCEFCMGSHRAIAARALGQEEVAAALDDFRSAPSLREPMRGAMAFCEAMLRRPSTLSASDAEAAYASGLDRTALTEVVHITAAFSIINPLADSLGFVVPSASGFARFAGPLLKHGYKF